MAINLSDPFPGMAFVFHPNHDDGDGDNDFNTFTVSLVVNIVSGGKLVMIVMTNIILRLHWKESPWIEFQIRSVFAGFSLQPI